MILCPFCKFENLEGMLFCDDCGTPLLGSDLAKIKAESTHKLQPSEAKPLFPNSAVGGGTTILRTETILVMAFENQHRVTLEKQTETVLGRKDENTKTYPDIDLTPYGAVEKGVSRNHAAIRRGEDAVMLVDLGSANGTYLNGKQIMSNQPHILRDGDEIRFGKLVSRIYFT